MPFRERELIHLEKRKGRANNQERHSELSLEIDLCAHVCLLGRRYCICRSPKARKGHRSESSMEA